MTDEHLHQLLATANRNLLRYEKLLELISLYVWVSDVHGESASIMLGESSPFGRTTMSFHDWMGMIHPDDQAALGSVVERAKASNQPFDTIIRGLNADGQWRKLRIQSQPILASDGTTEEWVGVSTDVTRQEDAEAELRSRNESLMASQERLNIVLGASDMGVWECDLRDGSLKWTSEVGRILSVGDPVDHIDRFRELVHPDDLSRMHGEFQNSIAGNSAFHGEFRTRSPDGTYRWMQNAGKPYYDECGNPVRMVGIVQDITDRRAASNWLIAQNDVLHRIASGRSQMDVFESIVSLLEAGIPDSVVSMVLNHSRGNDYVALGPVIPRGFLDSIEARPLNCAEVAGRVNGPGDSIIVEDLSTDPGWLGYPEITSERNLRSCWAVPLFSGPGSLSRLGAGRENRGHLEGVLCVYLRRTGRPAEQQLQKVAQAAHLASIALERYRNEKSVLESENRFRKLADAMPQLVWTTDETGKLTYRNQRLQDAAGVTESTQWLSAVHPDDQLETSRRLRHALASGDEFTVEHRLKLRGSGQYRWFLSRATASRNEAGIIDCWYGAATNIDDLKRTEQELIEKQDRLSAIATASPGVIFSYLENPDGTGSFPYLAPTISNLLGVTHEAVRHDAGLILSLIHSDDVTVVRELARKSAAELTTLATTFRVAHPVRGLIWVECQASPCRVGEGSVCWHGVLTDITQRKLIEEKLLQSAKMEAIGRLAGGIAHDFNNLLTVIISSCDLLDLAEIRDASFRESIEAIRHSSLRAAGLTRQLLTFSRQQEITLQTIDANSVVRDTQRILRRLLGSNIILEADLAADLKMVRADPLQLEQILINLVVNSRDAMLPDGGLISIATRNERREHELPAGTNDSAFTEYVVISVSDTGHGIDPHLQSRIFEPFFTTKAPGHGTGLGLAVVHGIVAQSGGLVEVDSAAGTGTLIRILLPAMSAAAAAASDHGADDEISEPK